jgi:hypothetical protein
MKNQLIECNFPGCKEKLSEDSAMFARRYLTISIAVCRIHFKVMQSIETIDGNYYTNKRNEKPKKPR